MTRANLKALGLTDETLLAEAARLLTGYTVEPAVLKEGDSGRAQVYRQSLFDRVTHGWHNDP